MDLKEKREDSQEPVLGRGYVRLVGHMGDDLAVVRSARVSYNAEWRAGKDAGRDEKLIFYLMANKHTSPFEAVTFTFEIKAPIFVTRQWHRHRTWSYNEVSGRYSELPDEFYLPDPEIVGVQSEQDKQARVITGSLADAPVEEMRRLCESAFKTYHALLSSGVPREVARIVLPLATYTRFFATVNLHNLFHFLRLRMSPHAQWEIQQYAAALLKLIEPVVPVSVAAFKASEQAEIDGEDTV